MSVVEQYLFGIDLDGTLLSPSGSVTDRTKAAVRAILAAGHKVAFATGRNYTEARRVFDIVEHHDLAVLVSGAIVYDTKANRTLRHSAMDPALAGELCGAVEDRGYAAIALTDRHYTGIDYLVSANRIVHEALNSWISLSGQRSETRPQLAKHEHPHTLRISTVLDYKASAELKSAVMAQFGNRAYVHGVIVPSDGVEIIEMFDPKVNKWLGLTQVADHHGIPHGNIVAVGDDHNDLPMIRNSRFGAAMGNARTDVKAIAKRVIGSNADDGLAVFLEQWLTQPELRVPQGQLAV